MGGGWWAVGEQMGGKDGRLGRGQVLRSTRYGKKEHYNPAPAPAPSPNLTSSPIAPAPAPRPPPPRCAPAYD